MPSCSHREDFVVDFSAEWTLNWIQRGLGTHFCGRTPTGELREAVTTASITMTFLKRQIRRNLILLSGAAVSEQAAYPSVPYGRGDSAVGGPPWRGDRDSGWRIEQASLKAGANGKDKDVSGGELRSS